MYGVGDDGEGDDGEGEAVPQVQDADDLQNMQNTEKTCPKLPLI